MLQNVCLKSLFQKLNRKENENIIIKVDQSLFHNLWPQPLVNLEFEGPVNKFSK